MGDTPSKPQWLEALAGSVLGRGIIRLTPPPDHLVGQKVKVLDPGDQEPKVYTVVRLCVTEFDGVRSSTSFVGMEERGYSRKIPYDRITEVLP